MLLCAARRLVQEVWWVARHSASFVLLAWFVRMGWCVFLHHLGPLAVLSAADACCMLQRLLSFACLCLAFQLCGTCSLCQVVLLACHLALFLCTSAFFACVDARYLSACKQFTRVCVAFAADPASFVDGRDLSGDDLLPQMRPYCPLETMDSEDLLFILYTSGSTGKPKVNLTHFRSSAVRPLFARRATCI